MKYLKCIVLLTFVLTMLNGVPIFAQEILEITPSQLTVNTVRLQTVSRTLLIRAHQAVNNISIIPLDLKNNEGSQVLPANAIRIESSSNALDSNGMLTVVIHIDLQSVSSGQYSGDLLISHENGSRQVPITVTVKDPPYIPALVLVAGVGLGLVVSEYRSKGKPRDEILVNLGQIRTQIKVDEDLQNQGNAFYNRIQAELVDVEVALEAQQWEQATTSIEKARTVWSVWRRGRSDWLVQLEAYGKLLEKLESLGGKNAHYIASLFQIAEDTYRKTPTFSGPEELREQLLTLYSTTNGYVEIRDMIAKLAGMESSGKTQAQAYQIELEALTPEMIDEQNALKSQIEGAIDKMKRKYLMDQLTILEQTCSELPVDASGDWSNRVNEMKQELANLVAGDISAYLDLADRVGAAVSKAKQLAGVPVSVEETLTPDFELAVMDAKTTGGKLTGVPDITLRSIAAQVVSAGGRLRVFTFITYAVAVILLALAGFVELYVTRSDFGSKNVADYFGLLAWGFGAEATRAAITDMVKSWGMVRK